MNDKQALQNLQTLSDIVAQAAEQARCLQKQAELSLVRSEEALRVLKRTAEKLPAEAASAVGSQMETVANVAAKRITGRLSEANVAAEEVTSTVRRMLGYLRWRIGLVIASVGIVTIIVVMVVSAFAFPTTRELKELRAEREKLITASEELRSRGADLQLKNCLDGDAERLCVRVDKRAGANWGEYMVLYGH